MFVSCVCCVFYRKWLLRRADHSFRGVLPGEYVSDLLISTMRWPRPSWAVEPQEKINIDIIISHNYPPCKNFKYRISINYELRIGT
jgi:hypothetical protein